jgi:hypothetical protein
MINGNSSQTIAFDLQVTLADGGVGSQGILDLTKLSVTVGSNRDFDNSPGMTLSLTGVTNGGGRRPVGTLKLSTGSLKAGVHVSFTGNQMFPSQTPMQLRPGETLVGTIWVDYGATTSAQNGPLP